MTDLETNNSISGTKRQLPEIFNSTENLELHRLKKAKQTSFPVASISATEGVPRNLKMPPIESKLDEWMVVSNEREEELYEYDGVTETAIPEVASTLPRDNHNTSSNPPFTSIDSPKFRSQESYEPSCELTRLKCSSRDEHVSESSKVDGRLPLPCQASTLWGQDEARVTTLVATAAYSATNDAADLTVNSVGFFQEIQEPNEISCESSPPLFTTETKTEEPSTLSTKSKNRRRFPRFLPNVGRRRCAGCTTQEQPASVWCCECARCLCTACDERMHDTDALDSLRRPLCSHRVELIMDGGGLPILSPLFELTVLAGVLYAIRPLLNGTGTMLNVDYFFESVCPIVQQLRRWVFRLDHALYPVVRGPLGAWCDTEDAFLKIFSDLWVRGILTHTDSFALLLMKAPSIFGALIVYLAVAPLLAIPYAVAATMVRGLEITILPNWRITRALAKVIRALCWLIWSPFRFAGWCCRSTALGLVMDSDFRQYFHRRDKIPPKTGARLRPIPSNGVLDLQVMGGISRVTRVFAYFHRKARRAIIGVIVTVVFLAICIRVVLLSLPRCGNGLLSKYVEHEMWNLLTPDGEKNSGRTASPTLSSTPSSCVSMDVLARKMAHRIGVEIPEFSSLGEEGQVLTKMQHATENDYLDDTLYRVCHGLFHQIWDIPWQARAVLLTLLTILVFSGLARRSLFWMDLQRRDRFRRLRNKREVELQQTQQNE